MQVAPSHLSHPSYTSHPSHSSHPSHPSEPSHPSHASNPSHSDHPSHPSQPSYSSRPIHPQTCHPRHPSHPSHQALGFQILWMTIFWFHAQRSWETIPNNFLVPWKFKGTHNVQKHVVKQALKLKNIRVHYYSKKTSVSIKMSEEGQFNC